MRIGDDTEAAVRELEERLRRYPWERYPVQHATAQFHLGVALMGAGRLTEAEDALETAVRLFDPDRLAIEHGKTMNAIGALRRMQGRLEEAATAFALATDVFERSGAEAERGAALFNLGLVHREQDDPAPAVRSFREARSVFDAGGQAVHSAAATRELGGALFADGDLDGAAEELEKAAALADRVGDQAGLGASYNALGLVHMAAGRIPDAVDSFRMAASTHPRSVRPHDFAMAKANLALAYEGSGDGPRARLAALQALAAKDASPPVRAQAAEVMARVGNGTVDLMLVLDQEDTERWPAVVREELVRWADAPAERQQAESAAWIEGQLRRPQAAVGLAEVWLGALLELPPSSMEALMRSTLEALERYDADARGRFRTDAQSAMARFHIPQLMRLQDTLNRLASELDQEPAW